MGRRVSLYVLLVLAAIASLGLLLPARFRDPRVLWHVTAGLCFVAAAMQTLRTVSGTRRGEATSWIYILWPLVIGTVAMAYGASWGGQLGFWLGQAAIWIVFLSVVRETRKSRKRQSGGQSGSEVE